MIIDAFLFNNELDLLELRLETLFDYVDRFLIIEGDRTHQNRSKYSNYLINEKRFEKYKSKIWHYTINEWPPYTQAVDYAIYSRNQINKALEYFQVNDEDIILVSDVDEIVNPIVYHFFERTKLPLFLHQQFDKEKIEIINFKTRLFYYFFNLECCNYNLTDPIEFSIRALKWKTLKNMQTNDLRLNTKGLVLEDAGWHWSFLTKAEGIVEKLNSYGHDQFKDLSKDVIEEKIRLNLDLFGRDLKFTKVDLGKTFPPYLLKNEEKFKEFIL